MDDEFLAKLLTLGWWLPVIVLTFVLGLPLIHAVYFVDTACIQTSAMVETGASMSNVATQALAMIQSEAPTQMDRTVLFDPAQNFGVTSLGNGVQQVRVTYNLPVFGPITHMFGWAGPTIPITDTQTVTLNRVDFEGVPYTQ